ncbi:MAG: tetratricopeptide repeat protein [Treponema sp.]|nr:tetratricopeptide repeat protein [Treponema sp.]
MKGGCVFKNLFPAILLVLPLVTEFSCVSDARAEDYYALGSAYFDLGNYEEAEKWFAKSKFNEKTKMASVYSLGRVSFERGDYDRALEYFENILKNDPENLTALRAAAYTCVKTGDARAALGYYRRAADLLPEHDDERYNYARLLAALEMYEEAETVLLSVTGGQASGDDKNILLLARVQKSLGKPEAVDTYNAYLTKTGDPAARFEFAETLEEQNLYAKALEEYRRLEETSGDGGSPEKSLVLFRIARVMLVSDPADEEGFAALEEAIKEGYSDRKEIDALFETADIPEEKRIYPEPLEQAQAD